MRGLRAFNFKKGIIGNSTLSLDSLILHVMDTGISITEGVVEIYDVVINGPPNDMGTVGIAYSGVHGELNVNSCFITCFETGIETSGTALLRGAIIHHCSVNGIVAQNNTEPYLCEVSECNIDRCKYGVYCSKMFVAVVDSFIRYATTGVYADENYSTRVETTIIHACDTIIHCYNAQVMKVLGCCLYDCRNVFNINTVDCFNVCGCRVLYFRRTAFLMTGFVVCVERDSQDRKSSVSRTTPFA